jgi:hypothetical protein
VKVSLGCKQQAHRIWQKRRYSSIQGHDSTNWTVGKSRF